MVSIEPQLIQLLLSDYEGDKHEGRCHGTGKGTFSSGVVYDGTWEHGVMHGRGTLTWPDGVVYEGDVQRNKLTGVGRYTWPDGSEYAGDVHDGLRHGQGNFVTPSKEKYEGSWKDGLRDGVGVLWYNEQHTAHYKGDWLQGQRHGHGVIVYASGASYTGDWAHNRKNGSGVMVWPTTNERYQGDWLDDYQHGFGEHVWVDDRPERATVGIEKQMCNIYRGNWQHGQRCGHGVFFYSDGSQYSGQWEENQKHGYGVHVFADGRMYEGEFRDDKIVHTYNIVTKTGEIPPFFKLHIQDVVQSAGPDPENYQREVLAIEKLLLRYQSDLKILYKQYTLQSQRSKYIFSMRMQQFWQFLYECNIMPQITAAEVGLCLQDMHRQQAHLLWVNHLSTAVAASQNGAASPETMVETTTNDGVADTEAAAENVADTWNTISDNQDVVLDDADDGGDNNCACVGDIAPEHLERVTPEYSTSCNSARSTEPAYEVKLHDVYEVHHGGYEAQVDFEAYIDPERPILLREFAELLVRVCARYTQRYFEGQGGLHACISILFEHKVKPLAQRSSKLDDFTHSFFSTEMQSALKAGTGPLDNAFHQLCMSHASSNSDTVKLTSLGAILSWAMGNNWIAKTAQPPGILQCMNRCKNSSNRSASAAWDPTVLLSRCVFFEFTEILCRLLDSEYWQFPQAPQEEKEEEDENPETAIPQVSAKGDDKASNNGEQSPASVNEVPEPTEEPTPEPPPKTLLDKLHIFLEQQLASAAPVF